MNPQLVFFAEPAARRTDPATSHAAAALVAAGVEERIVAAFAEYGALTDDELTEALPEFYPPTVKTARSRLSKRGVLIPTGGTRMSFRNRAMTVWAVAS
jgi:hypothetical protein